MFNEGKDVNEPWRPPNLEIESSDLPGVIVAAGSSPIFPSPAKDVHHLFRRR